MPAIPAGPADGRTLNGTTSATNDVGLITLPNGHQIAVAVLIAASPADIATRERTIARLARVAYDAFNAPDVY